MGLKTRTEKYQLVVLNFGYVESFSLAKVFFVCNAGTFPTKEEAVAHLALSLLIVHLKEQEQHLNACQWKPDCCKEAAKHEDYDYCPKCRRPLKVIYDFDEFQNWLEGFPGETANSFPLVDDYIHWWPWVSWEEIVKFSDRAVEIEDSAEQVLPAMIDIDKLDDYKDDLDNLSLDAIKKIWKGWAQDHDLDLLKRKIV
jgi:hypothetical protein